MNIWSEKHHNPEGGGVKNTTSPQEEQGQQPAACLLNLWSGAAFSLLLLVGAAFLTCSFVKSQNYLCSVYLSVSISVDVIVVRHTHQARGKESSKAPKNRSMVFVPWSGDRAVRPSDVQKAMSGLSSLVAPRAPRPPLAALFPGGGK